MATVSTTALVNSIVSAVIVAGSGGYLIGHYVVKGDFSTPNPQTVSCKTYRELSTAQQNKIADALHSDSEGALDACDYAETVEDLSSSMIGRQSDADSLTVSGALNSR